MDNTTKRITVYALLLSQRDTTACTFEEKHLMHTSLRCIRAASSHRKEVDVDGKIRTFSGLAGTCCGGARYAGFDPWGRLSPLALFADTRTK